MAAVREAVPDAILSGDPDDRLPANAHFTFPGCEGDSLLLLLDAQGIQCSTGSACSSGAVEPSKTLIAIGLSAEEALSTLRVSVGLTNRPEEIDAFLAALAREVAVLRRVAPLAGAASVREVA